MDRASMNPEVRPLARRLLSGDSEAIQDVYRRVRRIVGAKSYRLSLSEREDVIQEIVVELWRTIGKPSFDLDRDLWGFVEVLALRRCIDAFRRHRPMTELDPESPGASPDPLQTVLANEKRRQVRSALNHLSADCRSLIRERVENGLSFKEISEVGNVSEGALRVRFHRCVSRAREIFFKERSTP